MRRRTGLERRVIFVGEAALNRCFSRLLSEKPGVEVTVPHEPQIVGTLGAALLAEQRKKHNQRSQL